MLQTTTPQPLQSPMRLQIGKAPLHRLATQAVQRLALGCLHPNPQRLDHLLPASTTDRPTRRRIARAGQLAGTRPAVLSRAAIQLQHHLLATRTPLGAPADVPQFLTLRAPVNLSVCVPGELILGDLPAPTGLKLGPAVI